MSLLNIGSRPPDKPFRVYPDIPPDTYFRLSARAKKNFRSIRAEITAIIEEAVNCDEGAKVAVEKEALTQ